MSNLKMILPPEEILKEQGWEKGAVAQRKDALNYPCGLGIFTGEFGSNESGITVKFYDGSTFLVEYCTLVKEPDQSLYEEIKQLFEDTLYNLQEKTDRITRDLSLAFGDIPLPGNYLTREEKDIVYYIQAFTTEDTEGKRTFRWPPLPDTSMGQEFTEEIKDFRDLVAKWIKTNPSKFEKIVQTGVL